MVAVGPADLGAVRRLPQVVDSAELSYLFMFPEGGSGPDLGPGLDPLVAGEDGMWERMNRPKLLEGRRPDRSRADEVSISRIAAQSYGLRVGHPLEMKAFAAEQVEPYLSGERLDPTGPRFTLRIVGRPCRGSSSRRRRIRAPST